MPCLPTLAQTDRLHSGGFINLAGFALRDAAKPSEAGEILLASLLCPEPRFADALAFGSSTDRQCAFLALDAAGAADDRSV